MNTAPTNKVSNQSFDYKKVKTFEGLVLKLERNLKLQKENPQSLVETSTGFDDLRDLMGSPLCSFSPGYPFGEKFSFTQHVGLLLRVYNCELDIYDGTSPLGDVANSTEPSLQMRVVLWQQDPLNEKFKSLPCASLFTEVRHETTDGDVLLQYFINCKDNAPLMAAVYTMVATQVYGIGLEALKVEDFSSNVVTIDGAPTVSTKQELQEALKTHGLPTLFLPRLNYQFLINKSSVEEVAQLIATGNPQFVKHFSTRYELDKATRMVTEYYDETKEIKGRWGFGNQVRAAIRGFFEVDAEKLQRQLFHAAQVKWKY